MVTPVETAADITRPAYYAVLPAGVRYDESLPASAKLLYAEVTALARAEGYCWAANDYFAKLYGVKADTISRLLGQLEARGYLRREVLRDDATNEVQGRRIWIVPLPEAGEGTPPPGNISGTLPEKNPGPPGKISGLLNVDKYNINNIPPISPTGERSPEPPTAATKCPRGTPEPPTAASKCPRGTPEPPKAAKPPRKAEQARESFDRFWSRYPARKGRRGKKQEALTSWMRLSEADRAAALAGLEAYCQADEVRRGYPCDAVRYLRHRRWEDDVLPEEAPPPDGGGGSGGLLPGERLEDYTW